MLCPREKSEGAGNTGCWLHPRALRAKGSALCARKHQQGNRDSRRSLRDGLRLIRGLLGVPGLLASVARGLVTRRLDPSVGGSGRHDFARPPRCRSPRDINASTAPRFQRPWRSRYAPPGGGGMAAYNHIFPKNGRQIFLRAGLDTILIKRSDLPVVSPRPQGQPWGEDRTSPPRCQTGANEPNRDIVPDIRP